MQPSEPTHQIDTATHAGEICREIVKRFVDDVNASNASLHTQADLANIDAADAGSSQLNIETHVINEGITATVISWSR